MKQHARPIMRPRRLAQDIARANALARAQNVWLRMTDAEQRVRDMALLTEAFRAQANTVEPNHPLRKAVDHMLDAYDKVLLRPTATRGPKI